MMDLQIPCKEKQEEEIGFVWKPTKDDFPDKDLKLTSARDECSGLNS